MSEIPFVKTLGDALESAATARIARRRRLRRRITGSTVAFAVAASGVAAASGIFASPERLATTSVACYERADLDATVSIVSTGERSPVETCARVLRTDRPLVACVAAGHVAVLPGRAACERVGLPPLTAAAGYTPARAKVNAFARDVMALETSADCIPPREFERRVQALLDRSGWTGWRTWLRLDVSDGPCGTVSSMGGTPERTIEGALDADGRRVMVFGEASRSTMDLLYGPAGLAPTLEDASGERCFSSVDLRAHVRRVVGHDRAVTFEQHPRGVDQRPMDARADRLREGCAVVADVQPAADGHAVVVTIDG